MLLCDTGVLLAAGNIKDQAHRACIRLLRQAEGPLLVPSPVLGEVGYLLQSRVGPLDQRHFAVVRPSHTRAFTLLPGSGA